MDLLALMFVLTAFRPADRPDLVLEPIAQGLARPVAITHAGDERLFITGQDGVVYVHDGLALRPQPFLDLTGMVNSTGERGLLSIAFHPRYAENGFFFVHYNDLQSDTVIARFQVSGTDRNVALPDSRKVILTVDQPFANHNGGQLQFGPDGYLYLGMGDGGSGGDPGNRAQDLGDVLGKMLRIDVDGEPYAIPPSNPYATHPLHRPEIWASGLRNPWRFSFDRLTGDLWIADVGQGNWEEVNFQPATSIGGENYGWRRMEGTHCFNPATTCNDGSLILPVIEYGHTQGRCSVTGGYVYRGTRSPRLNGLYVFADFCSGTISAAQRIGSVVTTEPLLDTGFLISSFGEDSQGELYVADYASGSIYRLADARPTGPKRRSVRH